MTEVPIPEKLYGTFEIIKKKKYKNVPKEPVDIIFVQEM